MTSQEPSPVGFFKAMHRSFAATLEAGRGRAELIDVLTAQAFDLFEHNVEIQGEGLPDLACHKGCPSCCNLRITATAPEIFLLARYLKTIHQTPTGAQLDLPGRVAEADRATRGLGDQDRLGLRRLCPLILRGVCIIHPVRPLACRGHASFDKRACAAVAAGRDAEVPISAPHAMVRSLVQNAMQAALRHAGYAWTSYELNEALCLALSGKRCLETWMEGGDALEPARLRDVDWGAMARTFDDVLAG